MVCDDGTLIWPGRVPALKMESELTTQKMPVPTVELDLMTPGEVVAARARSAVAYVPIGPLEWHGPHLPLGTDGLRAHHVAVRAARIAGGVVLPTLFAGTETVRPPGNGAGQLGALGFDGDERIVGMDFPGNSVKSLYYEESAFGITVREVVALLKAEPYRLIVLVNGHGADNHKRTLGRLAAEETDLPRVRVLLHRVSQHAQAGADPGHAERWETSALMALEEEHVRLEQLPPRDQPLRYRDFGIVEGRAFDGHPAPGFVLSREADPRSSTRQEGERMIAEEVAALVEAVRHHFADLSQVPTP